MKKISITLCLLLLCCLTVSASSDDDKIKACEAKDNEVCRINENDECECKEISIKTKKADKQDGGND